MNIEELRVKGKELGIKQAMNMKEETLLKRIEVAERAPALREVATKIPLMEKKEVKAEVDLTDKLKVVSGVELSELDKIFLKGLNFNSEWLASLANQYDFDKFQYLHKFRAFRCYRGNMHVEWISVNDLSLLNGGRPLCEILLKHTPLSDKRQIIKYNWR